MKSGFQASTGPSLPWPGKERAGAERSLDPTASSTGSSRLSSPGTPGASSCPPSYSLTCRRRGKGLSVRGSSGRSRAEQPESKAPRVLGPASGPL